MSRDDLGGVRSGPRLADRVAVVAGGGGLIGAGIGRRLAEEGAAVVVVDIDGDAACVAADALRADGHRSLDIAADLTLAAEADAVIARTVARFGRLDVLVNSAGLLGRTPFLDLTEELWDLFMAANLKAPFLLSQAATRHWATVSGAGAIVNIASVESSLPFPDQAHYAASKGGVLMFTRALARDLAPLSIRVNAVGPGTVVADEAAKPNLADYLAMYPLGRLGRPDDIAAAVAYLASPDAAWVTGQIVYVDGGLLVRG